MKVVLCHFYNEEFLLPWWLKHHRKQFDHGIMIDYHSTDNSRAIINEYCPDWDVFNSSNNDFGAMNVDTEVESIETWLPENTWRMCLNVTEFLHGDMNELDTLPNDSGQFIVPSVMMISKEMKTYFNHEMPLTDHVKTGVHWQNHNERVGRSIHNFDAKYPKPGRHYFVPDTHFTDKFVLFHYGWAPMCDELLNRKLQIQTRIPQHDRDNKLGWHHIIERDALIRKWKDTYVPMANDATPYINYWLVRDPK